MSHEILLQLTPSCLVANCPHLLQQNPWAEGLWKIHFPKLNEIRNLLQNSLQNRSVSHCFVQEDQLSSKNAKGGKKEQSVSAVGKFLLI